MTEHNHTEYVEGCHRCELNRDEAFDAEVDFVMEIIQNGRACTPLACKFCRTKAEAIVRKLSE